MNATALFLAVLMVTGGSQQPASSADERQASRAGQSQPRVDPDRLPVSVDRIQRMIAQPPALVVREPDFDPQTGVPTFRVQVEGQKLTIDEILGPDYLRGPVPAGAMTHQEFLNMVTPTDVQGYAAFSNGQAAMVALTSLALKWALKSALEKYHQARDERAREAARKEVQDALEELRKARLAAGLPDR
jgi:hypothetical protein